MTIAGGLELVAWILSAVIAGWLVFDMARVARTHDEQLLINAPEPIDAPVEQRPAAGSTGSGST
jgi:hypothetical protein